MEDVDPIFGLPKPVIFAHRGGAAEAPESTVEAFLHGLAYADVLEVDLQLNKDGTAVVWHGPSLHNTFDRDGCRQTDLEIYQADDKMLAGLWVMHPKQDVQKRTDQRQIMTFAQFVTFVKDVTAGSYAPKAKAQVVHLNVELKKEDESEHQWLCDNPSCNHLQEFIDLIAALPETTRVIIACEDHDIVCAIGKVLPNDRCFLNLSLREQLSYGEDFRPLHIKIAAQVADLVNGVETKDLKQRAFGTSASIVTKDLIDRVHKQGSGVYGFMTHAKWLPELEPEDGDGVGGEEYVRNVQALIEMGIDGLMTDYPQCVRHIVKEGTGCDIVGN